VSNFDKIFKGGLKIYADTEANDGEQYPTDIGPIDIRKRLINPSSKVVMRRAAGRAVCWAPAPLSPLPPGN